MSLGPENARVGGLRGWLARRREERSREAQRAQLDGLYLAALERIEVSCEGMVDQIERRREAKHAAQAAALALQQAGAADDAPAVQAHVATIDALENEMNAMRERLAPLMSEKERLEADRRQALEALEQGGSLEALLEAARGHTDRSRAKVEAALQPPR